jgi:hypothetical protein
MNPQRRKTLDPNRFRDADDWTVEEADKQASLRRVVVRAPGVRLLVADLDADTAAMFQNRRSCDGSALELNTDGATAHLVEMKSTLTERQYNEAISQFEGTSHQIQMVAEYLQVRITGWTATLLTLADRLDASTSTNPAARRAPRLPAMRLGSGPPAEVVVARRVIDRNPGEIDLSDLGRSSTA